MSGGGTGFVFGTSGFGFTPGTIPGGGGTVATTGPRTYFSDFALANPIYAGALVAIVTVDPLTLKATHTLAPIYADLVSATQLSNPQVLDGEGKWQQPVYVGGACIGLIAGASDAALNTETGIVGVIGGFQGDWISGRQYFIGQLVRDGINGNDTSGVYYCDSPHVSNVFATDLASGVWLVYVDTPAILNNIITNTLTAAQASAAAALGSQTAAANSATAAAGSATIAGADQSGAGVAASSAAISANAAAASAVAAAAAAAPAGVNNVGRNLLHNSIFRVQQRGLGPFTGSGNFTADRWQLFLSSSTCSATIAGLADADRTAIGDETATVALQFVVGGTAGAPDFVDVQQHIEGVRRFAGKTVSLSFWAKATSGTPKIGYELVQNFGTGGSPSATVTGIGSGATPALSTAWTRYTATIAVPSAIGKTTGSSNDAHTSVNLWFSSGATNNGRAGGIGVQSGTIQIWGLQLEVGSAVTQLEKPDFAIELENCQRFYFAGAFNFIWYGLSANALASMVYLPTTMRATPTYTPTFTTQTNCSGSAMGALGGYGFIVSTVPTATAAVVLLGTFIASADL
jgi:hypothetical protein